jgi:ubiquinone/menaquinone biosynthesis C-methylase UbiE
MPDTPSFDLEAFRQFEHAGWNEVAGRYQATFGRLTVQAVEPLLDAAGVDGDTRVLDLACGSGLHARAALQRGAMTTGIDLSEAMVEQARREAPAATFHLGDAESLPFDDASFDAVVCGFGVLHFPDAACAVAEAWRVLAPNGKFACSVWRPPSHSPFLALLNDAVDNYGTRQVDVPAGPPPYRYGLAENLEALLANQGFVDIASFEIPVMVRLNAAEEVFDALIEGGVRSRALLEAQTPEAFAKIRAAAIQGAKDFATGEGIEIPRPALIAVGAKGAG